MLVLVMVLAFDPGAEAQNFLKINERAAHDYTPAQNQQLLEQGFVNEDRSQSILATDGPGRDYGRDFSLNLCGHPMNGCAGDIRLYEWSGIVKPVLFTQRNGSTLSGHVWATSDGPQRNPGS